jgi:hypothetical protein
MCLDPYEAQMMRNERVKDSLREAEQERLGQVANSARPRLLDRVVASIGSLLLSTGKKLQERGEQFKTGLTISQLPRRPTTRPGCRPGSRSSRLESFTGQDV